MVSWDIGVEIGRHCSDVVGLGRGNKSISNNGIMGNTLRECKPMTGSLGKSKNKNDEEEAAFDIPLSEEGGKVVVPYVVNYATICGCY
jgi:hypothetical protein